MIGPVAILGGGLTGLCAAWRLRRVGVEVVVYEAADRPGGVIGSTRQGGWLHEWGPNSLMEATPEVSSLIADLGLAARRLPAAPEAKNRYIVRDGRLLALPGSPPAFFSSPLFSWKAKARILTEPFRHRSLPGRDESVASFAERRLGPEFLEYAVDPFVGGIHAGDVRRLSMRHAFPKLYALEKEHGSLLLGAFRKRRGAAVAGRIVSFPGGLEELTSALAPKLDGALLLKHRVLGLSRTSSGWDVRLQPGAGGGEKRSFQAVVCALPADAVAGLALEGAPGTERLAELSGIEQPAVASVFTGFRREQVSHPLDGFGLLVPSAEKRRLLGTLFSSTLFPGRAPEGHVALTSFVGGALQGTQASLPDAELIAAVGEELGSLLGIQGVPLFTAVRRWPRAIPQYNLGFERFEAAVAAVEHHAPGLFIGGTCRDGISLAACMNAGNRLAEAALSHLREEGRA